MSDRRKVLPQYALPKRGLTAFAGRVASRERGATTLRLVRWFVRKYGVDMAEALQPDLASYATFNDFFTRALRPDARPIATAPLVSPVDGAVSQLGPIEHDQILQAKGHRYSTAALVGGDTRLSDLFHDGAFATIYLSPRDYHRIHMPCGGVLRRMIHVPGALFSVNPVTARGVPSLFARNERVVCVFDSPTVGTFVLVLVGATIVGSMATVWHGVVNPPRTRRIREWHYGDGQQTPVLLKQGEEMGRFLLGSTVVLLFSRAAGVRFEPSWDAGRAVRLGEPMATVGQADDASAASTPPDPPAA